MLITLYPMPALNLFHLRHLRSWLWILLLCANCDGNLPEWPLLFYFGQYPVRNPLDLTKVLGETTRLLLPQDTLELRIQYEVATGLNFISDAASGDTLQRVWVTRHRSLYYFTWPISDTCYWVHAVRKAWMMPTVNFIL
jgi:hypothetical protein